MLSTFKITSVCILGSKSNNWKIKVNFVINTIFIKIFLSMTVKPNDHQAKANF